MGIDATSALGRHVVTASRQKAWDSKGLHWARRASLTAIVRGAETMAEESSTYLTLSQVAARTGRHPELLRQWCAAGRIPCLRLGGSWVVREEDVPLLDRIATRARRRPEAVAVPSGRTRSLAAVFDDGVRAEAAAQALRDRLSLPADSIETAPVSLKSLGVRALTFVAGTVPEESSLDGRRILASYGGRIVAELDGGNAPSPAARSRSASRRVPARR
jgi:hypothetical protein